MNASKLLVIVLMIIIGGIGANVLHTAVSRSQSAYRPPFVAGSVVQDHPIVGDTDPSTWKAATRFQRFAATLAIEQQLNAFKMDDYAKASEYQSESLKHNFRSIATFRGVIQHGYPEFAHYKTVTFGDAKADPNQNVVVVKATLTGEDGITVSGVYFMHLETGGYKVAGVMGGSRPPVTVRGKAKAV